MTDETPPSAAAQAFLNAVPPELPPLNSTTAMTYRQTARVDAMERAQRAIRRHGVQIAQTQIADVPCLIVTPPEWEGARKALYCFGGGFFSGSAREDLILAAPLAAYGGLQITLIDYRLAPEHPFPAAIQDGMAVYQEMCRTGPFALIGESAGGNLALVLLLNALAQRLLLPQRVALLSPWCDLSAKGAPKQNAEGDDPTLTPELTAAAIKLYAGHASPQDPQISPGLADWPDNLPPFFITTGTRDLLRDQVVRLADHLRTRAAACDLRIHPHMWHVFEFYDEIPEADQSLRQIAGFLRA